MCPIILSRKADRVYPNFEKYSIINAADSTKNMDGDIDIDINFENNYITVKLNNLGDDDCEL